MSHRDAVDFPQPGDRKPLVGVVGAIGAGKSTAARVMAELGGKRIDADVIGHEVLGLPEVRDELVKLWGNQVLVEGTESIDRRAVARLAFPFPHQRYKLERVVFPRIATSVIGKISAYSAQPETRLIVLDAAVMLEAGWNNVCDRIVYIDAPRKLRLQRLAQRSQWSAAELANRESAQMPAGQKMALSHAIIWNDGHPTQLEQRVRQLLKTWDI